MINLIYILSICTDIAMVFEFSFSFFDISKNVLFIISINTINYIIYRYKFRDMYVLRITAILKTKNKYLWAGNEFNLMIIIKRYSLIIKNRWIILNNNWWIIMKTTEIMEICRFKRMEEVPTKRIKMLGSLELSVTRKLQQMITQASSIEQLIWMTLMQKTESKSNLQILQILTIWSLKRNFFNSSF